MKDHKQVTKHRFSSYELEGPLSGVIQRLTEAGEGLVNPWVKVEGYDSPYFLVVGWVPMLPEEIAKMEIRRQAKWEREQLKKAERKARKEERLFKMAAQLGYDLKEKA